LVLGRNIIYLTPEEERDGRKVKNKNENNKKKEKTLQKYNNAVSRFSNVLLYTSYIQVPVLVEQHFNDVPLANNDNRSHFNKPHIFLRP